jgi:hypothetical protein
MGWLFTEGQSRREVIHARLHRQWREGYSGSCLAHALRGNVLWSVWKLTTSDGASERIIGCDVLTSKRDYGWGYKHMKESVGPCYYSCPLAYLDMTPTVNEGWRNRVRECHERRKTRRKALGDLHIGETVPLEDCVIPEAMIVSLNPLQGYYHGRVYELRRRFISAGLDRTPS